MANQQLVDYIKQQMQLGVSKDAVKGVLAQAGWPEADVNEALAAALPGQTGSSPAVPAASSVPGGAGQISSGAPAAEMNKPAASFTQSPQSPQTAPAASRPFVPPSAISQFAQKPVASGFGRDPAGSGAAGGPDKPAAQSPFIAKDIFQPKSAAAPAGEPVFQPRIQAMPAQPAVAKTGGGSAKKYALLILWAIVTLALLGAAGYFFWKNRDLNNRFSNLLGISASLEEANARIATLTAQNGDLLTQFNNLNLERADLALHLSFFLPAVGGATTTDVTLGGTIGGGGRDPYTITTKRQLVVSVRNSSASDVSRALLPLIGKEAVISGKRVPGTREIIVEAVNGEPVEKPAASPTGSTSTPTSASPLAP
jgi:hypothetical protein